MIVLHVIMKINLFIKYYSEYGGAERVCYSFSQYLASKGIETVVFCGDNKAKVIPEGVKIVELGLARPGRYKKTKSFYDRAGKAAKNTEGINFSFERIPNIDIFRPGGGSHSVFAKKSLLGLSGWALYRKKIKRMIDPVNRLVPKLEKKIANDNRLKFIIAVSGLVCEEMMSEFGIGKDKFKIIYNGVDKKKFNMDISDELRQLSREKFQADKNETLIGFASSNFQLKGLSFIIEALALLPDDYKLLVAGGRNPEFYINQSKKLGVENKVVFLGKVTDMQGFYAGIDVFCHPTFFDPYANVINEAGAMGVPVAVSRQAGNAEFVEAHKLGAVIENIDAENIAKAIQKALNMGRSDYINRILSREDVFEQYLELCRSVAE